MVEQHRRDRATAPGTCSGWWSRPISIPASRSARGPSRAPRRLNLSPASIRNVMQDLEESGLLAAPHTSAGRIPTETGLRLFVDAIMQVAEPRRRGPRRDRGADRPRRPDRGGDQQRHRRALRPFRLRRHRAGAEGGAGAEPARLRAAVAAPGGGGDGRQRRQRREPGRRPAAGCHPVDAQRGRQLCQRPPLRPHPARGPGAARRGDQGRPGGARPGGAGAGRARPCHLVGGRRRAGRC